MTSFSTDACATDAIPLPKKTVDGVAVVEDTGLLRIDGQRIKLWGIELLSPDQQCWQDGTAWLCGEETLFALKHFVAGRLVHCAIEIPADEEGPAQAQCYRWKHGQRKDIAQHMIEEGWALEKGEASGGIYFDAEQEAQGAKRGAWSGRFQTPQDWQNGIPRFVGEGDESVAPPLPPETEEEEDTDAPNE
ncbi:MAG: thermonuclease family protein [Bdellovibrionales bacterium]